MGEIVKGEKGLVSIRVVDEFLVETGSGNDDWEWRDVEDERIGHFAPYHWSVGKKYEIEYAPSPSSSSGGRHVIRVVDDEVANTYDPFEIGGSTPDIKGKTMLEGLVAIGRGDQLPAINSNKAKKILEWVSTFGLLENEPAPSTSARRRRLGVSRVRHKEISLEDFWLFAKDVRGVLAMAYEIRRGKIDGISEQAHRLRDGTLGRRLSDFEEYLVRWAALTYYDKESQKWEFRSSDAGLRLFSRLDVFFREKLGDLTVGVSGGLLGKELAIIPESVPTPGGLQLVAKDLKTGIYAEAALVASGAVAVDLCQREGCEHLVVKTKSNRLYCSDACRSMVSQRRRGEQTS